MQEIVSFPPLARHDARLLILGSMPGKASLLAGQYYAHPRNLFWPIVGNLIGASPQLSYDERTAILVANGVALWDVLKSCRRNGSLDASIDKASMVVNDFSGFFNDHPAIERIFFNGATAELVFRRHVLPTLTQKRWELLRLPSTSPANAARTFQQKLAEWQVILQDPAAVC